MSTDEPAFAGGADYERLLGPFVGDLAQPTSLSPLAYDLNAGVPDHATLPVDAIADAMERALRADPGGALTYGGAQGYEPLRAWIADRESEASGLPLGPANVTLCSGSAHAIDNIAATFLGPGDVAVISAPAYPGAIRSFRARGARIASVPQDEGGMRADALEEALERIAAEGATAKLIYLVATYDNPSGATVPLERREQVVEIAARHGVLIVEDDAYAGLDFDGPAPDSLFSVARGRGVLHVGTASKTIATGLRVGWVVGAEEAVRHVVFTRLDNGSSPLVLRTLLAYYEGGTHPAHLERIQGVYRERRDVAAEAVSAAFGELASFVLPGGGFYLWIRLAEGIDASALQAAAAERDVAVTTGTLYAPEGTDERHIRLAYPTVAPDTLREAIARLGEACAAVASRSDAA